MKNIELEEFYDRIKNHLKLNSSFTEEESLPFIIRACRLKPVNLFTKNFSYRTQIHYKWLDEFGNSLNIDNKILKIILNDCFSPTNSFIKTDLLHNISLNDCRQISVLLYNVTAVDEDTEEILKLSAFLGLDNYLRLFVTSNNVTVRGSPLLLGLTALNRIYINKDTKTQIQFDSGEFPLPCTGQKAWIEII